MTNTKRNEHPRCSCRTCVRGAGGPFGQYVHRAVNRRIRHQSRVALRLRGAEFEPIIVSTGYTD